MGSCSSVHRNANSVAKFNLSRAPLRTDTCERVTKPTVVDDVDAHIGKSLVYNNKSQVSPMNSFRSFDRRLGSKEDTFFDSRMCMDSDCDDFYSVNGDFTPSRGTTPVHPSLMGPPLITQPPAADALTSHNRSSPKPNIDSSSPSPTGKRNHKTLVDLFRESIRITDTHQPPEHDHQEMDNNTSPLKTRTTPDGDDNFCEKDSTVKAGQCCFPRLVSVRSFKRSTSSTTPSYTPSHAPAITPLEAAA